MTEETSVTKDFDFDNFLKQLGSETPDMSVIKAGIEKYGTGQLSDEQKEAFFKTVMPQKTDGEKESVSLGFQNVTGIKNVMKAVSNLQTEGKIGKETVKDLMTTIYPDDKKGKNMAMALALNVSAAEFKLPKIGGADKEKIEENLQAYKETLEQMGQIKPPEVLNEALKQPNYMPFGKGDENNPNNNRSVANLAGRSETLHQFVKDPAEYKAPVNVDGEKTYGIGGNNTLKIDGEQKPPVTVKANEDDKQKTASLDPNNGDPGKGKSDFDMEKVKEQDIIQYMFENWFLEGLSWAMKIPFKIVNKGLDSLNSRFDSNISSAPLKKNEIEKNKPAVEFLNTIGNDLTNDGLARIIRQRDYYQTLADTYERNAGRKPEDWEIGTVNGKQVLDWKNNKTDLEKINKINKLHAEKGKNGVHEAVSRLREINQEDFNNMSAYVQRGALIAGAMYTAKYPDGNPEGVFNKNDPEAEKLSASCTDQLYRGVNAIYQSVTDAKKIELGLDPNDPKAKLSPKDEKEALKKAENIAEKYIGGTTNAAKDLRAAVYDYENRGTKEEKEARLKTAGDRLKAMHHSLSFDRIDELLQQEGITQAKEYKKDAPVSAYDLAKEDVDASRFSTVVNTSMQIKSNERKSRQDANTARKQKFAERKAKILDNMKGAAEKGKEWISGMFGRFNNSGRN